MLTNKNTKDYIRTTCIQPAVALSELVVGFAGQSPHVCHQDAALAAPAEPLAQRNLALVPHQASYQEQAAADTRIQATKEK